jgi:hypothetical protein
MAFSFVQSKSHGFGSATTGAITLPSAATSGNCLIVAVALSAAASADTATLTDNLGQTYTKAVHVGSGSGDTLQIWYLNNTAGGAQTVTVTCPSGFLAFAVHEYYGSVLPAPFTVTNTSSSASPSTGAIPIVGSGVLTFAAYKNDGSNLSSATVAAPFTVRENVLTGFSTEGIGTADDLSSSGSVTATWTLSGSIGWVVAGVAFQPGSGAPTTAQTSQSGRNVVLVAVSLGNVYYSLAGTNSWNPATNGTGNALASSGVIRSAANNQKLYFADGSNYLYFDPKTIPPSVQNWTASFGSLPSNTGNTPRLICTWRGRTVLSGIKTDPQNWFMSAVSDPTNFDYFPGPTASYFGPTQAVAGNNSPLGLVGDVITSLVPYSDDVLIFGGDHTIWACRGDPMAGGSIDLISDTIGFAWGNPWCKGPDGTLYFVSNKTGIYSLQIGQQPVRMSGPIEQLLSSIDSGLSVIRMQWDDQWQGFHTWISLAASAAATTHFFWEGRTGAWWTDVFGNASHNPLCCVTFDGNTPGDRKSLIGSFDGYVRCMTPSAVTDDGTPIASSVVIGPLLTKDFDQMLLKDLQILLGIGSGPVAYAVYIGPTAEIALTNPPVQTGTWSVAGRNLTTSIRRSGHAIYVKLSAVNYWSQEGLRARVATKGKVSRRGF